MDWHTSEGADPSRSLGPRVLLQRVLRPPSVLLCSWSTSGRPFPTLLYSTCMLPLGPYVPFLLHTRWGI